MAKPIKRIHFIAIARSTTAIILAAASASRRGRASCTSTHKYIVTGP